MTARLLGLNISYPYVDDFGVLLKFQVEIEGEIG